MATPLACCHRASAVHAQFGLKKYGLRLIRYIYSIEIIDFFFSTSLAGRAVSCLGQAVQTMNQRRRPERYDGEMGIQRGREERRGESGGGGRLITTERQETLKFRAVTVNTRRRVSLLHGMRREAYVKIWGLALILEI